MGKIKCFKITLVFLCLTLCLFLTPAANADGCVFIPTVDEWIISYEEKQIGIIDYEHGIENLTLMIDIKNSSLDANEAFWLFAVPGHENIDIDIISEIDYHQEGRNDIRDQAKEGLSTSAIIMSISQAYVSFFPVIWYYIRGFAGSMAHGGDVIIYDDVEKMGFTSQLLSANTSQALDAYMEEKNISLPDDALEIIDEYIGKDYSFVLSWISDIETFKKEAYSGDNHWYYYGEPFYIIGITVNFPTNEIYYPLKITSLYGEKVIPILIQVNDFVTPKNTFNDMEVSYYSGYTEIEIKTEAKDFTEDLWIKNEAPASVHVANFIQTNLVLFSIILFILSSILASLAASLIVYYKNKPVYWKFLFMGLGNFLSIFFVFGMCLLFKINQTFVKKPVEEKKKTSRTFNIGFRITFLVLGLICLALFLIGLVFPAMLILLPFFGLPVGILMFIYGGIKNPKATLYTALFSIFFFVFLITLTIITQMAIS